MLCFPRLSATCSTRLRSGSVPASGDVAAVALEVRNMARKVTAICCLWTNGFDEGLPSASFDKQFYVSGFVGMDARYECCVLEPGDHISVSVREFEHE